MLDRFASIRKMRGKRCTVCPSANQKEDSASEIESESENEKTRNEGRADRIDSIHSKKRR